MKAQTLSPLDASYHHSIPWLISWVVIISVVNVMVSPTFVREGQDSVTMQVLAHML